MLACCKIRKIVLYLLFISKFCTHTVLWLSKFFLIIKIAALWLSKSCWLKSFGTGNHSSKYIKIWLYINKTGNIQAFTFRKIKRFSVTLEFLLLVFWPFQDISVCVSAIYCKMGKLHCMKFVQIRSYFLSVFSCIWTEYGQIRTRNNSVFGHFSRSVRSSKYCFRQ